MMREKLFKYADDEYSLTCNNCYAPHDNEDLPNSIEIPFVMNCRTCKEPMEVAYLIDYSELEKDGYECTDPDNNQYVQKLSPTRFAVIERNTLHLIDLDDYSEDELNEYVDSYYGSVEAVRHEYGEQANKIIAECIAEQTY